jgi:hypothetical protein
VVAVAIDYIVAVQITTEMDITTAMVIATRADGCAPWSPGATTEATGMRYS